MTAPPGPGSTLGGYRLEEPLGRGGMGVVHRARDLRLDRDVAVKLILPELAQDPGFRERFERESRTAASIEHPNVIPIYEAGEADGILFIAMRLVRGTDLRELITARGRLAPAEAAEIVAQVAAALDAAHARGLVHRDVKPANVLIASEGGRPHAYLTDFGLTKRAAATGGLTTSGAFVGTVDYAAPEQLRGERVDARTDVYALGCVLFQAVTGTVPFPRDADMAKMWAHVNDPAPRPSERDPGLPRELDTIVARALDKDPAARYPSAGDLARAVLAAAQARPLLEPERSVAVGEAAPTRVDGATLPAAPAPQTAEARTAALAGGGAPTAPAGPPPAAPPAASGPAPPAGQPRRGRPLAIGGAVAAAAAGAAIAVVLLSGGGEGGEPVRETVTVPAGERADERTDRETTQGDDRARPPETQVAAPPPPGGGEENGDGFATYRADAYGVRYPEGWAIVADDVAQTSFRRTRFEDADGNFVLVDRTPGERTEPAAKAAEVEGALRGQAGYRRISYEPVTVAGRPAFEWIFETGGERRIDIFLNVGGDGYAVFGGGPDFDTALEVVRRVAESLEPR